MASAVGHLKPDKLFPGLPGVTGSNGLFAFEAIGYAHLLPGRIYRWGVVSDDGFRVLTARSATDTNAVMLGQFNGNPASADTLFYFTVTDEGLYPIRLTFEQHTGTGAVEFWDADMATGQYIGLNDPLGIEVFHTASATTRPTLSVSADGTSLRVSWTPTAGTQTLLSSGDLSSRRWDPVSQTPLENNGVKSVTIIPAPTTNIFFRVQQQ